MSKSGGNLRALVGFNLPTMPAGCSVAERHAPPVREVGLRRSHAPGLPARWGLDRGRGDLGEPAVDDRPRRDDDSGTGYREWNVAGMVQAMYTGGNHGFLVRDANENQDAEQQFHSREESTNRPQLVVTFGTGAPPNGVPETQITGSPLPATSSSSATFTFTGTDDATPAGSLTFECQLDVPESSPWTACTSPRTYSEPRRRSHTFRVRAMDAAGNVDPTAAVHTWTIDQTEPETVITSGPGGVDDQHEREASPSSRRRPERRSRARSTRRVHRVHVAEGLHGPDRRPAHLPGARDRRGRQRGPDARDQLGRSSRAAPR